MMTPVQTLPPPMAIGRALPLAAISAEPAITAARDNASRESARPVQPMRGTRHDPQITFPQLSTLLLPARDAAEPPGGSDMRERPEGEEMGAAPMLPRESPKGPLRSFAEIPTHMTKEIQKAREAFAEQGGGLQAIQTLMREVSSQSTPSFSITV